MKLRILFLGGLLTLLSGILATKAQTVDASFQATDLYRPGNTRWVAQQADGKYLIVGDFTKSATAPLGYLVRFNADFTPDLAFNAVLAGFAGSMYSVRVLPNGQLLVVGEGRLSLAGVVRQDLLLLNANGTPDASFDAGSASTTGTGLVVEPAPNGQLLVGGWFTRYNGVAHSRLVRLTATGSVDATFTPPAFADNINRLAIQPDGKILVGCQNSGTGATQPGLLRLNTNGSLDGSFPTIPEYVSGLALQADGKILIAGLSGFAINAYTQTLVRLLPNGSLDATFQGSTGNFFAFGHADERRILVQPDGRIIVNGEFMAAPIRFNANGSIDPSFQTVLLPRTKVASLALTASGQVMVAGSQFELPGRRSEFALLNSNGTLNTAFAPVLLTNGFVQTVAVQPNGMVLAGGGFDEVNGLPASNLTRFRTDGTADASFVPPAGLYMKELVLQPDGKILAAQSQESSQPAVIRLLPSGAIDASFRLAPSITKLSRLLLQPNGRLLVLADTAMGQSGSVMRLFSNGRIDHSFSPSSALAASFFSADDGVLQADGKILLVNQLAMAPTDYVLVRLLANGQLDPAFPQILDSDAPGATSVSLQPDGKILFVDNYYSRLRRLLPTGSVDAGFTAMQLPSGNNSYFYAVKAQPNGRILISGSPNFFMRLLPDGAPDASFVNPGLDYWALDLTTTPNGQVVAGGIFRNAGGQRRVGLALINATNVLNVSSQQVAATTLAWPNPAHLQLQVVLQASASPRQITLLDALGKVILTQRVTQPELTLNTTGVVPGTYILRVDYARGPVTRRVVLE